MVSRSVWTAEEAKGNFVRLLEQARNDGPQEIRDTTGIYELQVKQDLSKGDAANFLAARRPKG
ncbi:hypothetical protein NXC14_PC00112 (plasmid) [Rhizobium sp. NXC14]|uniref:hypothetical protein n=1 Tax=Rhizobium sp. NXC14 TaxID=1981173 RepID=UPI000A204B32|nr:hypothetical protein [Rhizobium sp. NXC14]ARO33653.1 hypothetical protein NXC14_PC00112 [Rhizobium sp. NXC14]